MQAFLVDDELAPCLPAQTEPVFQAIPGTVGPNLEFEELLSERQEIPEPAVDPVDLVTERGVRSEPDDLDRLQDAALACAVLTDQTVIPRRSFDVLRHRKP